jgi:RHS repeat-associated protein
LGRVDTLYVTNGSSSETVLAAYEYYPTGSVKSIKMGNTITLDYEYHISGAVKSAVAYVLDGSVNSASSNTVDGANSVPKVLYSETLYYEDCDSEGCTPQYNGNISRMVHKLAHINQFFSTERDVAYYYDELNRLTKVDDKNERDFYDEAFTYDPQGRITSQRRNGYINNATGGEYNYYAQSNRLEKVSAGMSNDVDFNRNMTSNENFIYDRDGNMIEDKSKQMTVRYNHRGLPTEFKRESSSSENGADSVRLVLNYDGAGSRISKIRERKSAGETEWTTELATHYTGIGSEIREDAINNATKVVVNLPQGLGRYDIASASEPSSSESSANDNAANTVPSFEWYLKNHLGSTMLVYGTQGVSDPTVVNLGSIKAAYDYRAFGEQVDLTMPTDKVTETFTGKEKDDETELSYFGARYLDQMLGMWVSVDAKRQFNSPYLYAGNGTNPVNGVDPDGNIFIFEDGDEVTPALLNSYYTKLSPEAKARYNQLDKSKYRYYVKKVDGVYPDKDFNDDEHFLGGEAVARTFVKDNGVVSGGEAKFANARYFLHEVLQHLFDFDNELKATNGDTDAVMNDYTENKDFYEQKAVDFEDPSNMQGVDLDAY